MTSASGTTTLSALSNVQ